MFGQGISKSRCHHRKDPVLWHPSFLFPPKLEKPGAVPSRRLGCNTDPESKALKRAPFWGMYCKTIILWTNWNAGSSLGQDMISLSFPSLPLNTSGCKRIWKACIVFKQLVGPNTKLSLERVLGNCLHEHQFVELTATRHEDGFWLRWLLRGSHKLVKEERSFNSYDSW